jgi:membrane protease YdiL (CAAX protease family)
MPQDTDRRAVPAYLLCTFALSTIFYVLAARAPDGGGNWTDYTSCLMWCPAVGAFLACRYLGRPISGLAWNWGSPRYIVAAYLIPVGYALAAYGVIWLTGLGTFYNKPFVDLVAKGFGFGPAPDWVNIPYYFFFTGTIAVIKDLATTAGEEIGWRGFLVPELAKRHGFVATSLISGSIWAIWHWPIIAFGPYHPPTPVWFHLPMVTLTIILAGFIWTWLRLKSGSIWPCIVLHAAHNTFIQRFFDPMTLDGPRTWYVKSEFGVGLAITSLCLAIYFTRRRAEVEAARN